MRSQKLAVKKCLAALDCDFLKAISEPARIAILKVIVMEKRCDVATVAQRVPQDRSVVARHLQLLARAQVVQPTTEGRHTFYQIDGDGVLAQLRTLVDLFERLSPLCCPPATK